MSRASFISTFTAAAAAFTALDGFASYTVRDMRNKTSEHFEDEESVCKYAVDLPPGQYRLEAKGDNGHILKKGTKVMTLKDAARKDTGRDEVVAMLREQAQAMKETIKQQNATVKSLVTMVMSTNEKLMTVNADLHQSSTDAQVAAVQAMSERPERIDFAEIATIATTLMQAKQTEGGGSVLLRLKKEFAALPVETRKQIFGQLADAFMASMNDGEEKQE